MPDAPGQHVKRALSPSLNPAGLMAAAGAIYAAVVMILNARNGHGVIDPPVIVAAIGAVAALLTRQAVTPVADPRDGNGSPLLRVAEVATARALERRQETERAAERLVIPGDPPRKPDPLEPHDI